MNIVLLRREELSSGCFVFQRTDERFRHIKNVLKLGVGSVFKAGIIGGEKGTAEITAFSGERLTARFTAAVQLAADERSLPFFRIRLILGFPRPIQLRRILRDVAGLGIEALYLTGTELGEKSYLQSDIAAEDTVRRLLIDGCSQAGETDIPQVHRAHSLRDFFDRYEAAMPSQQLRAVLDVPAAMTSSVPTARSGLSGAGYRSRMTPPHEGEPLSAVQSVIRPITALRWDGRHPLWLAVGNERGWSRNERILFVEKRFSAYGMGSRILRTETAVTSAIAACLALSGAWDQGKSGIMG